VNKQDQHYTQLRCIMLGKYSTRPVLRSVMPSYAALGKI
jgi:hypothetical protein